MKINKISQYLFIYFILCFNISYASSFDQWKKNFKILINPNVKVGHEKSIVYLDNSN